MAHGPGKYDPLATYVRESAHAEGVVVIVINGSRGTGFSVQGTANVQAFLPDLLDHVAAQIRADLRHVSASGFTPPPGKSVGTPIKHGESVQVYESPPSPEPFTWPPFMAPVKFEPGGGGDYAGAGASGSWDAAPAVSAAVYEASSQSSPPEPPPPPPPEPPPPPPPASDP
jgi:hypothetical protein